MLISSKYFIIINIQRLFPLLSRGSAGSKISFTLVSEHELKLLSSKIDRFSFCISVSVQ